MLREYFEGFEAMPVAPLVGYPALREMSIPAEKAFKEPEVHAKVIRKVVEEVNPDLVLPLLDLTVEAEILGAEVFYPEFDAPNIKKYAEGVKEGRGEGRIPLMLETLKRMKESSERPVGFYITGPFTIAGQVIEITNLLKMVVRRPEDVPPLLEAATKTCLEYGKRLEEAGADFIVIAEPSASLISLEMYRKFVKPYLERIGNGLKADIILHICGRANHLVGEMALPGIDGISIDQNVPLDQAFSTLPEEVFVFGNYPPTNLMFEEVDVIKRNVQAMVEPHRTRKNYVVSTGCDIPSNTPMERVKAFTDAARKIKRGG